MVEQKTGGWLSSVVGNISGLWSRSSAELSTISRGPDNTVKSPDISYEEQAESDVGEPDDDIIIQSVFAEPSVTGIASNSIETDVATPKRHALRHLRPSSLQATAHHHVSANKSALSSTLASRKRIATGTLFQDDLPSPRVMEASTMLSSTQQSLGGFLPKRSRMQRDFNDVEPFLSPSMTGTPATNKSHSSQSLASLFTPLNAGIIRPSVSRSRSTASSSSLSSKTRAILEQLEKISTPVKEVKRLSSFTLNAPERWATDAISYAVQKPPRNSLCTVSRAQLISNILDTKSTSKFWGHPTCSAEIADSSTHTSQSTESVAERGNEANMNMLAELKTVSSSRIVDHLSGSKKFVPKVTPVNVNLKPSVSQEAVATSPLAGSTTTSNSLKSQRPSVKTTNVFTAKVPELEVVSPVKEKAESDKQKEITSPEKDDAEKDANMFVFTAPMKRGPSVIVHCEDIPEKKTATASPRIVGGDVGKVAIENSGQEIITTIMEQSEGQSPSTKKIEKTQAVTEETSVAKSIDTSGSTSSVLTVTNPSQEKAVEKWICPDCMVYNNMGIVKCVCCGHENNPEQNKPWTCGECWLPNSTNDAKCIACNNAKQSNGEASIATEKGTNSSIFGDRTFKPVAVSKDVLFGFSAAKLSEHSVASAVPIPTTQEENPLVPGAFVNGNSSIENTPKFGITTGSSATSSAFGKPYETTNASPPVSEALPSAMQSSQPALTFGVPCTSSATVSPFIPTPSHPLSFPTLNTTVSSVTTTTTGSSFNFPITTSVNPFTFGSSNVTSAEMTKVTRAPMFTFGCSAQSVNVTTAGGTSASTFIPTFGTSFSASPAFSTAKAFFGTNGESASTSGSQNVVEMSSPATSPVTSSTTDGLFGMTKSSTTPLFNFGASNISCTSSSEGGLFGSLQAVSQTSLTTPTPSLFSFGQQQQQQQQQQQPQGVTKPFEPHAPLASFPSTFKFDPPSNGSSGFVFGSSSPPTNFVFGAPANNAAFNFGVSAPAAPFGTASVTAPNFFSVGSTSSSTRKMLKARRMRK